MDAPLKIESKKENKSQKDIDSINIEEKQKEILETIAKANKEAENLILQAQEQANSIIYQAQEEYNQILSQANDKAQQIIQETISEVEKEKREFSDRLSKILESFDASIENMLEEFAEKLTNISKVLIEKFLEKEIDPEVTKRKLLKILTHVIGATKVKIRINPQDLKVIDSAILDEIRARGYEIIPDTSISYGVVAETELGTIDSTLRFQFVMLDEIFEEVFKGENI